MIDPKYINDLSIFQELMVSAPAKHRAKYGDVTQYFLTHTAEERLACLSSALNLPISFFDFIFNHKSKPNSGVLIERYRNWSKHISDENLLTPFFFYGVLNHSPIAASLFNNLDFLTVTEPFKVFNLECIGATSVPAKRIQYTSSFSRMLGVYILFKTLQMDLSCFKYWSFDGNIEANLNSIGHSSKSVFKVIIQRTRERYGTRGFLNDTLTVKYLANIVDAKKLIPRLLAAFINNFEKLSPTIDTILSNMSDDFRTEGIYVRNGYGVIMALYIKQYGRWSTHSDAVLMGDGTTFYVHRHSMINSFVTDQRNVALGQKCVPESLDVKPSVFFKEYIKEYAEMEYAKIEHQYGTTTFEDMSNVFNHLDASKYRYLNNPLELILEGRNMRHCVGGSNYIDECSSSETFILHYADSSRYGYTIELTRRVLSIDDMGGLFKHDIYNDDCTGYTLLQIKGHNNDLPSPEVERGILIDLFTASAKLTGKVGAALDQLIHQHKVSFRNRHPVLKDHTTRDYLPVKKTYSCVPFKSINHQAKNELYFDLIKAQADGGNYGRGRQSALGWVEAYGANHGHVLNFGQFMHTPGLADDFAGDVMMTQMRQMHGGMQRNPRLDRGDNLPHHHMADFDISLMYPRQVDEIIIKSPTLKSVGLGDLFETLFSKTIRSVHKSHVKEDGEVITIRGFKRKTGRDYLIEQSLFSLGQLIISWQIEHGQVPLMVKLGMSILANKIRYGFMSDVDIVKILIRLYSHGLALFSPTVNWMVDPLPPIIRKTYFGLSSNPTYKINSIGERFNAGPAVVCGNMDIVHRANLHHMAINKVNHSKSKISATMNFNFNEQFTRNLFGGYDISFQ